MARLVGVLLNSECFSKLYLDGNLKNTNTDFMEHNH